MNIVLKYGFFVAIGAVIMYYILDITKTAPKTDENTKKEEKPSSAPQIIAPQSYKSKKMYDFVADTDAFNTNLS